MLRIVKVMMQRRIQTPVTRIRFRKSSFFRFSRILLGILLCCVVVFTLPLQVSAEYDPAQQNYFTFKNFGTYNEVVNSGSYSFGTTISGTDLIRTEYIFENFSSTGILGIEGGVFTCFFSSSNAVQTFIRLYDQNDIVVLGDLTTSASGRFDFDVPAGLVIQKIRIVIERSSNGSMSSSINGIYYSSDSGIITELENQTDLLEEQNSMFDKLINDADSAFQNTESEVSTSVSDYEAAESALVSDSIGRLETFDFTTGSLENMSAGVLSAFWWVGLKLEQLFILTDFSATFHVVAIISLVGILLGARRLWRD